jgi:PST family polysaccharide transporter
MSDAPENLTRTTGRALSWNYIGAAVRLVLSFGINILLTRLLGPKPFGELAIAMIVFGFGNLLASVGITSALIQKPELDDLDIRFCFTCQMTIGALMTLLLATTAGLWARFFHQPEVALVLQVFSLLFLFQTFGTTAIALLNRRQDVRTIQIISIISYVIAYLGIGVPLALRGAGIWSLVLAQLAQAFLGSAMAFAKVRHSVIPRLHPSHMGMLAFGFRILGANVCSWGISNLDNTVVGRVAGPVPLGFYSRAFSLAAMPAESIISGLLQVLLPALSRVQTETEKLRRIYASAFGAVLLVLAPMFAAMAAAPDAVVLGLYGRKWIGAVALFQPLALAIPINAVMALSGPTLAARGKPQREFHMQLLAVLVAAIAYMIAIRWSVLALSWAVLAVYVVRFVLLTGAAAREIGGRWLDLVATAWPGLVLAAIAAVVAKALDLLLPDHDTARLAVVAAGSALAIFAVFAVFSKTFLRPILSRAPQLGALVPPRLKFLLPTT